MNQFEFQLIEGAISDTVVSTLLERIGENPETGAGNFFIGQVRADKREDGRVKAINFTVYKEMAIAKAEQIIEEIKTQFPITQMHIYHSLGTIKVGEICLLVAVASAHRKESIQACNLIIERVKKEVPIWGKEMLEGEKEIWKENRF